MDRSQRRETGILVVGLVAAVAVGVVVVVASCSPGGLSMSVSSN